MAARWKEPRSEPCDRRCGVAEDGEVPRPEAEEGRAGSEFWRGDMLRRGRRADWGAWRGAGPGTVRQSMLLCRSSHRVLPRRDS